LVFRQSEPLLQSSSGVMLAEPNVDKLENVHGVLPPNEKS
jgi:hypothetical protein